MKEEIEDWKVTAFATGDLAGADRVAVERAISADPALSARVDAIRRQTDQLVRGLALEPLPEASPRPLSRPRARVPYPTRIALLRLAAAVAVLMLTALYVGTERAAHTRGSARIDSLPSPQVVAPNHTSRTAAVLNRQEEPSLVLRDDWDARSPSMGPVTLGSVSLTPAPSSETPPSSVPEEWVAKGSATIESNDYDKGGVTAAVTSADYHVHARQITIAGAIDLPRVWSDCGLNAVLDRSGPRGGSAGGTTDSDTFWSPIVALRFDVISGVHESGVIYLVSPTALRRALDAGWGSDTEADLLAGRDLGGPSGDRVQSSAATITAGSVTVPATRPYQPPTAETGYLQAGSAAAFTSAVTITSSTTASTGQMSLTTAGNVNLGSTSTLTATGGTATLSCNDSINIGSTSGNIVLSTVVARPSAPGIDLKGSVINQGGVLNAGTLSITSTAGTVILEGSAPVESAGFNGNINALAVAPANPGAAILASPTEASGFEAYSKIQENAFLRVANEPLSTFSIDVDTASYANVRRFIHTGKLPPPDAVRIEELMNYFPYDYAPPTDGRPFAVHVEGAACPWNHTHRLLRIGLKGREITNRPPSNLVFLLDVSGSMEPSNRLPLVKAAMRLLVHELTAQDHVSIVTYAGVAGLALPSTTGDHKKEILAALGRLFADGGTNGGDGIELAYQIAQQNFVQGGTNRVILATDGDWNVGVTSQDELVRLIEEKSKSGVSLSVLGVGMGNLKDSTMEKLADTGHGNYAYLDSLSEARKVLVEQIGGTLCTIAKDVKVQVEFNPARVAGYRLLGYENRLLAKEDFKDDKKRAGDIGAGHTVTALYEVIPVGQEVNGAALPIGPLKYQPAPAVVSADTCTVNLRYKAPDAEQSASFEVPFVDKGAAFDDASPDFRFAASVAGYGMLLRRSPSAKGFTWNALTEMAGGCLGNDREGYRQEFLDLVRAARDLARAVPPPRPEVVALDQTPPVTGAPVRTEEPSSVLRDDWDARIVADDGSAVGRVSVSAFGKVGRSGWIFVSVLPPGLILLNNQAGRGGNVSTLFQDTNDLNVRFAAEPGMLSREVFYVTPDVNPPKQPSMWRPNGN